jgi:hypothetical protein
MLSLNSRIQPLSSSSSHRRRTNNPNPHRTVAKMATSGVSAFLSQHDLQAKIEDALNRCVKTKPDEPLSFLVSGSCGAAERGRRAPRAFLEGGQERARRGQPHLHSPPPRPLSARLPSLINRRARRIGQSVG